MKSFPAASIALAILALAITWGETRLFLQSYPLTFHAPPNAVTLQHILNATLYLADGGDTRNSKGNFGFLLGQEGGGVPWFGVGRWW